MDVNDRIRELAAQGLSDQEIAEELTRTGLPNKRCQPFTGEAVRLRRHRAGIKTAAKESEPSETSDKFFALSEESGISEGMTPLPEEWKVQIVQIVREELQRIMEPQILQKLPIRDPDLPPMPEAKVPGEKGRPVNPGGRVKIAGTVDKELDRLFEKWRTEKGITLSRALDAALWNFLGRPPLSFEISEESESE